MKLKGVSLIALITMSSRSIWLAQLRITGLRIPATTGRHFHLLRLEIAFQRAPSWMILLSEYHQAARLLIHQAVQPRSASVFAPPLRAPSARPKHRLGSGNVAGRARPLGRTKFEGPRSLRRWKNAHSWGSPLPGRNCAKRRNVMRNGSGGGGSGRTGSTARRRVVRVIVRCAC